MRIKPLWLLLAMLVASLALVAAVVYLGVFPAAVAYVRLG